MDRDGVASLSMRKLGATLDVEAMSLYHHFPNKAALLAASRIALFEKLQDVGVNQADGFERLRAVMQATYRLVEEHPSFVDLLLSGALDPSPLRRRDADLVALRSTGLTGEEAGYALQNLIAFVIGSLHQGVLTSLNVRDAGFEFGLDLILDGLRRKVRARPH